jgi:hypothetical protein
MMDRCYMCKRNGESVDYSLLHYNVASTIWCVFFFFFFFSLFGISLVMPRRVVDLYNCWWFFGRPRSAALWKMMPMCLF